MYRITTEDVLKLPMVLLDGKVESSNVGGYTFSAQEATFAFSRG